jgi:hypothetical protein
MIIVVIIAVIIAIPLLGGILLSEKFSIETNLNINRSKQDVFDFIKLLRNCDQYNKWVMQDPNLRKEFEGTDATVGFVYKWESDVKGVGKGEQHITGITEGERVDYEIRFIQPFQAIAHASLILKEISGNQTNVTWSFSGTRNFPMRIFHFLLNMKKILTKDLHTGLTNLKNVLEK